MTTTTTTPLEVTAEDRALVGDIADWMEDIAKIDRNDTAAIRNGYWDDKTEDLGGLLQIAARHRIVALASPPEQRLREALESATDICASYASFIRDHVRADDLEMHPYLPEIEDVVASSRQALERNQS